MSAQDEPLKITVLSPSEIEARLNIQRMMLAGRTKASIEHFLTNDNKTIVRDLLNVIRAFDDPEEGFRAFVSFMNCPDEVRLREQIRKQHISFFTLMRLVRGQIYNSQMENGIDPNSFSATIERILNALTDSYSDQRRFKKFRGALTYRQQIVFQEIVGFHHTQANLETNPILFCARPLLKKATERLTRSFDNLVKEAGKPFLNEDDVRSLYDEILSYTQNRFEDLTAQSYGLKGDQPELPVYGFSPLQMPEGIKFGLEAEGFTAINEPYPRNARILAKLFNAASLPTRQPDSPKMDDRYDLWNIVYDASVKNPLHFVSASGQFKFQGLGLEVISNKLEGSQGGVKAAVAFHLLNRVGFYTNETCGFHVHVDLEKASLQQKKNLIHALKNNETALDALIDPSRRGNRNAYCLSVQFVDLARVDAAKNDQEMVEAINPGNNRNYKFDFTDLVLPDAPQTIHYRGSGGASYMNSALDYAIIIVTFTKAALDDRFVRLEDIIERLNQQSAGIKKADIQATANMNARHSVNLAYNHGMFVEPDAQPLLLSPS